MNSHSTLFPAAHTSVGKIINQLMRAVVFALPICTFKLAQHLSSCLLSFPMHVLIFLNPHKACTPSPLHLLQMNKRKQNGHSFPMRKTPKTKPSSVFFLRQEKPQYSCRKVLLRKRKYQPRPHEREHTLLKLFRMEQLCGKSG